MSKVLYKSLLYSSLSAALPLSFNFYFNLILPQLLIMLAVNQIKYKQVQWQNVLPISNEVSLSQTHIHTLCMQMPINR